MTGQTHRAFLLSEAALEDLLKRDRGVFVPEPSELYREVGGNWHMVEMDYPAICYEGQTDDVWGRCTHITQTMRNR